MNSKLYHTGIETNEKKMANQRQMNSKLYHTGIETKEISKGSEERATLNCTTLELKLYNDGSCSFFDTL